MIQLIIIFVFRNFRTNAGGTKTSRVSTKALMKLPDIVKEISKKDKQIKTFLVNCHPYVVAPLSITSPNFGRSPPNGMKKQDSSAKISISRK